MYRGSFTRSIFSVLGSGRTQQYKNVNNLEISEKKEKIKSGTLLLSVPKFKCYRVI